RRDAGAAAGHRPDEPRAPQADGVPAAPPGAGVRAQRGRADPDAAGHPQPAASRPRGLERVLGAPLIVDVHIHFLSPHAIEAARRAPGGHGVRVLDDGPRPRLAVGDEPPTRPLLEPLYTLDRHLTFLAAQGIDAAVFGPLMDVAGYSLPPAAAAAWS